MSLKEEEEEDVIQTYRTVLKSSKNSLQKSEGGVDRKMKLAATLGYVHATG